MSATRRHRNRAGNRWPAGQLDEGAHCQSVVQLGQHVAGCVCPPGGKVLLGLEPVTDELLTVGEVIVLVARASP